MDTISVLSSAIKKNSLDNPINKSLILFNAINNFNKRIKIKKKNYCF